MFTIINGGKGRPPRPPKLHWLADHLWRAIVTGSRATSQETLRTRMARTTRQPITLAQTSHILNVVRSNPDVYNWSVLHVAKGADDTNRRFIPALVDYDEYDEPYIFYDEDDLPYVKYGVVSSARTIASMSRNESTALDLLIAVVPREKKRVIRAMQSTLMVAAEMADKVASQADQWAA